MKFVYVSITLVFAALAMIFAGGCGGTGAQSTATASEDGLWLEDYNQAVRRAREENKPILMDFTGSDWCGWCIKLDEEVFSTKEFQDYAEENLVLLKLDFPKRRDLPREIEKQNRKLADLYGIQGFPTIVIIDKNEVQIGEMGYVRGGPKAFIRELESEIS